MVLLGCGGNEAGSRVFGDYVGVEGATIQPENGSPSSLRMAADSEAAVAPAYLEWAVPQVAPPYLVVPVAVWTSLGDRFGAGRLGGLVHGGLDFELDGAEPVYAPCDGVVSRVARTLTYGPFVIVDCGNGWNGVVGWLSDTTAVAGDEVRAGETVIGATGTGSTIHLEIRYQDKAVNPEDVFDLNVIPGTPRPVTPTPTATATPTSRPYHPSSPGGQIETEATKEPVPATATQTEAALTPTATATATSVATDTPTPAPTPTPTPRPLPPTPTPLPQAF